MKVSDYVAEFLRVQGVEYAFEVIGGMITHLVDSIYRSGKINLISTHHEQAAAFAADAMARITGVPGVALATSGPGATNLLTGIGSCYFDSVPAVFITGQVNRNEQKANRPVRQLGFQETDIVSMAKPITKATWNVIDPEKVPSILEEAFKIALSGRPGPVLIDLPMDVQRANIPDKPITRVVPNQDAASDPDRLETLLRALKTARRPLILAGGGIRPAQSRHLFREFVEAVGIPVITSLMAVDALPYQHPLRVGLIGSYGNRWANLAIGRSDLLLVLGSRLDIRQTGADVEAFQAGRAIYQVDIDAGEMNNRLTNSHTILAHLVPFLTKALAVARQEEWQHRPEWVTEIAKLRQTWPDTSELQDIQGINPNRFLHELSAASPLASAFVVDVGNHQMWAAQSLEIGAAQHFLTSGGMGAMGYALPAAIGTALARRGQPVVMISGDGGMQFNIHELQTVMHHRIPIKMIVLNNQSLGMVRQFQQSYFSERYQSTYWGYSAPDFCKVAQAYGIASHTVSDASEISGALERAWQDPASPFLLQIMIDPMANAYPKIAFGRPITEMEPFAKPVDMEGT
ncbi:MAG: thiamine pyrophosphate-binding protein [Chloroflexi bacterium]|nr:thiamine pyrophosphate-binding protein [Chloroflexota bacterium]